MKIHADKIESPPSHALSVKSVKCILKSIPSEWTEHISEVRIANSLESAPRVFLNLYDNILTIHSRGATPKRATEMILSELAAVYHGYTTRHWHRLSASEKVQVQKIIQPLIDELLPVVTPEERRFIYDPTPAFKRVI